MTRAKLTERVLDVLGSSDLPLGEWELAFKLYPWSTSNRSKHGAWIRVIVQSLWKLESQGRVSHFWVSHGFGVAGDRMWFRRML